MSCDYGGLDGVCAYNEECELVNSCADINLDEEICNLQSSCKFNNICLDL